MRALTFGGIEDLDRVGRGAADHYLAVGDGHLIETRVAGEVYHRHLSQLGGVSAQNAAQHEQG
jgi:hypothetical protein